MHDPSVVFNAHIPIGMDCADHGVPVALTFMLLFVAGRSFSLLIRQHLVPSKRAFELGGSEATDS